MLRRFQFRLRTLMIVVTLLAVACWVVMDRARLIRERDEAVRDENVVGRALVIQRQEAAIMMRELEEARSKQNEAREAARPVAKSNQP
jgi:hypothetical protein